MIPVNGIKWKEIPFVKDNLNDAICQDDDHNKMDIFWKYFEKYWMTSEEIIKTWNINNTMDIKIY